MRSVAAARSLCWLARFLKSSVFLNTRCMTLLYGLVVERLEVTENGSLSGECLDGR